MNYRQFSFAVIIVILITLIFPSTGWLHSIFIAIVGMFGAHYLDKHWEEVKEWFDKNVKGK